LLDKSEIFSPKLLLAQIERAEVFLLNADGPNKAVRARNVPIWLGFWQGLMRDIISENSFGGRDMVGTKRLAKYSELPARMSDYNGKTGIMSLGGGEGTPAHRECYYVMRLRLGIGGAVTWALEPDEYFAYKTREKRYLPLTMLMSMWAYLGPDIVTVPPFDGEAARDPDYYNNRFLQSGVQYGFGSEGEPHAEEQAARRGMEGLSPLDTLIPRLQSFSTSQGVSRASEQLWRSRRRMTSYISEPENNDVMIENCVGR
jgi:hypothetical protein